jgi:hypothetical protein
MNERNLCHEAGCVNECCNNIYGDIAGRAEFFLKAFPNATKIEEGTIDKLKEKIKNREIGVYYYEERGWVNFAISGPCPNISNDGCSVHKERFYPRACVNMERGSKGCFESRELYAINKEVLKRIDL